MDNKHFALNQRKHERVETDIPCRLGPPGARHHDATILNLSLGGLLVACNHATFEAIIPEDQRTPGQVSDVEITIQFSLRPIDRKSTGIELRAALIHSERLAQDRYHIGLQFVDISKAYSNRIESFINEVLSTKS